MYLCKKKLKKTLSIFLLLHLCFSLLVPSITVLCFDSLGDSINWVASEGDNEVEEKKLDDKIVESIVSINLKGIQHLNILIFSLNAKYKSIHLRRFSPPPEV